MEKTEMEINVEEFADYVDYVPVKKRRLLEQQKVLERKKAKLEAEPEPEPEPEDVIVPVEQDNSKLSLLEKAIQIKKQEPELSPTEQLVKEEKELLERLYDEKKALLPVKELSLGTKYTQPIQTGWKAPSHIRHMSDNEWEKIRQEFHIHVNGEDVPPPVKSFKDMRFPGAVLKKLKDKNVKKPTPIQVQGMPVLLSGRDMIGVAYTGSGKTLTFVLPMIMLALEEELKDRFRSGEGPFGLILCPSRELARQTFEVVKEFLNVLDVELRAVLCTGGIDMRDQLALMRRGLHIVVATPGRLNDILSKKKMNLDRCKYVTLDEADRLVDGGFEDDVRKMFDHFKHQRQTVLFSATMPDKIQKFARTALVKPVEVNVARAGAANLDVVQDVDYVKEEAKMLYLLQCLQKTAPPVLVFCEQKSDADNIYEYLIIKGVEAACIHGGKDQEERDAAISSFKSEKKDVLVATDVASKGLDFPNVQHVINYDMPEQIEHYVHRIGRTGRSGKTGVATTFINKKQSETTLVDLKFLLIESKQKIPEFMKDIGGDLAAGNDGCAYCGGLGHRLGACPKLEHSRSQAMSKTRNEFRSGYGGEM